MRQTNVRKRLFHGLCALSAYLFVGYLCFQEINLNMLVLFTHISVHSEIGEIKSHTEEFGDLLIYRP